MTEVVIENETPPDSIVAEAKEILETTVVERVRVEDAVDRQWFIRVTGTFGDDDDELGQEEFDSVVGLVEDIVSTSIVKPYEGSETNNEYLIRIEY